MFAAVNPQIENEVDKAIGSGMADPYQLQQVVRRTAGTWVSGQLRRRPMIIPVVVEG